MAQKSGVTQRHVGPIGFGSLWVKAPYMQFFEGLGLGVYGFRVRVLGSFSGEYY